MAKLLTNVYDLRPEIDDSPRRQRTSFPEIEEPEFWELFDAAKPYSMLAVTGFYSLYQSLHYIAKNRIAGDFVECGALFGGACIFMALLRRSLELDDRRIHVFDTFSGFPEGSTDVRRGTVTKGPRYESFYEAVVANFERTCGTDGIEFHVGPVEETLLPFKPRALSLLRLDTDFYPSTKAELERLYPRVSPGGVLIIDDYGWYEGSRRATDDYFAVQDTQPLLIRVDSGIWSGSKPGGPPTSSRFRLGSAFRGGR